MPLIQLVVAIIIVGLLVYVIDLLPIDATFKRIARIVLAVVLVLWLLGLLVGYQPLVIR